MFEGAITVRPQLFTRLVPFVVTFFIFAISLIDPELAPMYDSQSGLAAIGLIIALFLAMSWRNWRLGVRVLPTQVKIHGFLWDRTISRSAVVDVTATGYLAWEKANGKIQLSPIVAFMDMAGLGRRHNERSLALLRAELIGDDIPEVAGFAEEDRNFDPPSYLRPRQTDEPPKHAKRRMPLKDTLLGLAMMTGLSVATVLSIWLVIEPALWLAHITDTPGLLRTIYSSSPDSRDDAAVLLIPHTALATFLVWKTAQRLYFTFRPNC